MPDWPFMSYQVDPYLNPTDPPSSLYPSFPGERCTSYRADPVPRGIYLQYAGATNARGSTICQGTPVEANVYGGVPGFGSSVNTAVGPKLASTGVNSSGGPGNPVWASPGNVGSTSFYTTADFATSAGSGGTGYNYASFFGFTIPLSFAVVGVNVIGVAFSDASAGFVGLQLQLLKNGQPVGTPKVVPIGSSAAAFNAGGNGDLWGIPGGLLASDVNQSNFGVAVAGVYQASYSSGVHTWSVNSVNVVIFAQIPPILIRG
jgi:hypothetical protein